MKAAFSPIAEPSRDVLEYLRTSGARAAFVARRPNGSRVALSAANPWADNRPYAGGAVLAVFWLTSDETASAMAQMIADMLARDEFVAFEQAVAQRAHVTHERAIAKAKRAITLIDEKFAALKAAGELGPINRKYKELRRGGARVMPYSAFLREYRMDMVRALGHEVAGRRGA